MSICLRKRLPVKVNCWFCQQDQRVPYEQRNSFICLSCEQYNGFDESGGYNRKIPGQHCFGVTAPPKRFCTPMKNIHARPDVVPREGYSSNGLCEKCNRSQEIIMRKVADFEPLNEDRWSEELEMYRYKLNKVYPLCARCTFFTQNRMQEEKAVRRRRHFFAGGLMVEVLHALSLVLALLLFISQFNYLQEDAGLELFWLPMFLQKALPTVLAVAYHLVGVLFCAHMITIWTNRCRITLPDLMLPVIAALHLASFLFPDKAYREDLALFRCAFACFETLLATAITFVPRKKIPRTRPNKKFSSVFSVVSTPSSQCSSQAASRDNSLVHGKDEHTVTDVKRAGSSPKSTAVRQRLKWRERQQTPEPATASPAKKTGYEYEDMDWEPSLDREITYSRDVRPSAMMARMIRESTPNFLRFVLSAAMYRLHAPFSLPYRSDKKNIQIAG
ncbi:unnamed protein product [Haemonchus placei]|uniref:Ima1 N-terminal domain-containing protein n=1 Tax=Haemonchus placei TaxID=6290 RepID=A0A3P7WDT0_HAEPC|nr:unnamed protein product [Haemonchus placei]